MPGFDDLTFEPLLMPNGLKIVPRYLFEQIKNRKWDVDRLYEYGPLFITNPLNRFWVLTDIDHKVKGVLWITIDPITEFIAVNILSIDKEYQRLNGSLRSRPSDVIRRTVEFLHKVQDELKAKKVNIKRKILWSTTRPRACERAGAKRYRVVMEI